MEILHTEPVNTFYDYSKTLAGNFEGIISFELEELDLPVDSSTEDQVRCAVSKISERCAGRCKVKFRNVLEHVVSLYMNALGDDSELSEEVWKKIADVNGLVLRIADSKESNGG